MRFAGDVLPQTWRSTLALAKIPVGMLVNLAGARLCPPQGRQAVTPAFYVVMGPETCLTEAMPALPSSDEKLWLERHITLRAFALALAALDHIPGTEDRSSDRTSLTNALLRLSTGPSEAKIYRLSAATDLRALGSPL